MTRGSYAGGMNGERTRRQLIGGATGLASILAVGAGTGVYGVSAQVQTQQTPARTTTSWPMYQADAHNSGVHRTTGPTEPVEAIWKFEADDALKTQPIVADGTVYVPSMDGKVYAVAASTGSERWSIGTNGSLDATPAITNGILYVPTNQGTVLALSAGTGSGQWKASLPRSNASSLTAAAGDIYVSTDGNDRIHGSLSKLDGGTGDELHLEREAYFDHYTSLVTDAAVYLSVYNGNRFIGYDRDNWSKTFQTSGENERFTYHSGTLYTAGDRTGIVRAIDAETGKTDWTFSNIQATSNPPVYYDDTLYVTTTADNKIHAIDPSIGTRQWEQQVEGTPTTPVAADGTIYFGAADNQVYAYDAVSGERRWTYITGNSIVAPPSIVDGTLYVTSTDNVLYALREEGQVSPGDVNGDGNPAHDLDEDGLYEDVNGDGAFTIVDVQALFANLDSDAVQNNPSKFDFNGDGKVDVTDVQALYALLED